MREDLGPYQGGQLAWSDGDVFVAADVVLNLSFPAAGARLAHLARGGLLSRVSQEAPLTRRSRAGKGRRKNGCRGPGLDLVAGRS